MNAHRNLRNGEREVARLLDDASVAGYDVIELLYNKTRPSIRNVVGFKVPKIRHGQRGPTVGTTNVTVSFVEGSVNFYPDGRGFCYGYVIDIPENRLKIAQALKTGWYRVVDNRIAEEIKDLAREYGLPTSPLDKPQVNIVESPAVKKAKAEAEEYKKRVAELEQRMAEMHNTGEAKLKKPLEGVSLKPRKKPGPKKGVKRIGSHGDDNQPITEQEKDVLNNAD